MTKRFCNKCGKELNKEKFRKVNMRIYGKMCIGADWDLDFCENCFADIMGEETYSDFVAKEKDFNKRVSERKAKGREKEQ